MPRDTQIPPAAYSAITSLVNASEYLQEIGDTEGSIETLSKAKSIISKYEEVNK